MNKDEFDNLRSSDGYPSQTIRYQDLAVEDRARTLLVGYNTTAGTPFDNLSIHVYSLPPVESVHGGLIVVEWWRLLPGHRSSHLALRKADAEHRVDSLYPWKRVYPERSSASFIRLLRAHGGDPSLTRFDETWESPGAYAYPVTPSISA